MIYLTQLVYIHDGQEHVFDKFEELMLPVINKYNGRIMLRIRPFPENFIGNGMERPYEIHLVEFASEQDFENFKNDKERQGYLHLKEQAIRSVLLIQGYPV